MCIWWPRQKQGLTECFPRSLVNQIAGWCTRDQAIGIPVEDTSEGLNAVYIVGVVGQVKQGQHVVPQGPAFSVITGSRLSSAGEESEGVLCVEC